VRLDVELSHADFGKPKPCPACSVWSRNPAEHCEKCASFLADPAPRNQCWKCGKFQDENAGKTCGNPAWHYPNWSLPEHVAPRDYPGLLADGMKSA
jgi:hypothetical protein